ncbi:YdcF family protein [Catenibacterium faecis]|uniref:YdcF family protein n=1 Tax=Catenibacterium faecis TaxID=2764323 RepID=UPI003F7E6285
MIFIPLIILLFLYFMYCMLMRYESRTLWSGVGFFGLSMMTIITAFFYAFYYSETLTHYPLIMDIEVLLAAAAVLVILFFPLATIIMFFVEGIKVIKHEGLKLTNLLSLIFAIGLFIFLFVGPIFVKSSNKIMTSLYAVISFAVFYLLSVLASYCLSAFLNTFHLFKKRKLDYIIVLGAGIKGEQVPPLLASRIDQGIEILKKNPKALLIMSGGQGKGEDIPEGEAMARYAINKGIDESKIIIEDKSTNTKENLLFSSKLMTKESPRVGLVTTSYHVFRALILAKDLGIRCIGFGSVTKWYFTLNALIREFIGYLSMTWKKHVIVIILYSIFIVILSIVR